MSSLEVGDDDSHGYFVPMIDMLAGVIFILIIMLAAVSLVSRDDFHKAGEMQGEIKRIQAELDQARQEEKTYIEPRRIARAALRLLLQRLQGELAANGVPSQIFPDSGRLLVTQPGLFDDNGLALSGEGQRVASVLAAALDAELPCLALEPPGAACAAYAHAHLDEATVVVTGAGTAESNGQGAARALAVLSALAADRPALLLQQAIDKHRLLDYRAEAAVPAVAASAVPAARATPRPADGTTIGLAFTMNVPPLPPRKK
jgi:hypothetical protein